uniref:TNF superfamily member 14 n=1 Tax=Terrapene triunguis TaxID=2587831 RepID=A0A674JRY5_9SAUR
MGDGVVYPSVFVVDGQQHGVPFVPPMRRKRRVCWHSQFFLASLVILALAGVATEGYFLIRFQKELEKATSQVGVSDWERGSGDESLPAAHVLGAAFTTSGNGSLQWEHSKDWAFLHDMRYQGGSLVCIKPGYYYIYSKIHLMAQSCSQQDQNSVIYHSIYKKTPRYVEEMKLVENLILFCDGKDSRFWRQNSFLGGIFHLEEEEQIYVKVSQRQMLQIRDGTRSYFGTFMI